MTGWLQKPSDKCMTWGLMTHGAVTKKKLPTIELGVRSGEDSNATKSNDPCITLTELWGKSKVLKKFLRVKGDSVKTLYTVVRYVQ